VGGRAVALATLVALVAGTVACGSDGGRLSAHDFSRRAAALCSRADHRATSQDIPPLEGKGAARTVGRIIEIEREALRRLHELRPPKAMETRVDEWLATVDQLVVEAEFLRESLRRGDQRTAQAVAIRAARLSLRSQVLGSGLGVTGCTVPTPPPVDPSSE
jgi:hypothetical protein